jgi:crotonobetainyl-CoA:carnitine CoA-transferase CaiB-like acyl-CoA transferase
MLDQDRRSAIAGLRVLDLSGPPAALCGKLLADLGADVVRFEPAEGDAGRRLPPFAAGETGELASLHFWYFNTNKRSCRLHLRAAEDRQRLRDLVPNVDVVLESFPPGHLDRLGLGPAALGRLNPGLIIASVTPFGQGGPFRDFRGSNLTGWAMGGCLIQTGDSARAPLSPPGTQAYYVAALYAAAGILAALWRREAEGRGAHLDISVQEAVASLAESTWSFYHYQGERPVRANGEIPLACPLRVFPSRDGYAFIGLAGRAQWQAFLDWMAETLDPGALAESRFLETVERVRERELVNGAVRAWARTRPTEELVVEGARRGIPNAPVNPIPALLEDAQLRERRFFVEVPDPRGGAMLLSPGLPFRGADGSRRWRSDPAPRVGADTEQVLREWADLTPRPPSLRGKAVPRSDAVDKVEARVGESGSEAGTPFPRRAGARDSGRRGVRSALPLAGVKVLELAWQIAGPMVGRVLGDLGADVVKVEAREVGDPLRGLPPFQGGRVAYNRSGTFHDLGRNKRSLTLDLKHPRARPILERLVGWADVMTENFTPETLDRLGFPYPVLRTLNPRLILTSVCGNGQTGPRRTWPCYHPTAAAFSGLTGLFAYQDGEPTGFGNSYLDYVPGLAGAIATIEALLRRAQTGRGEHIDVSQIETGVYLLGAELFDWQVNGGIQRPQGNRAGALGAILQDVLACAGADTWLAVTVETERELEALGRLLDLSPGDRTVERVRAALADWLRAREAWEAFYVLQREGIAAGVVEQGPDLLELDPHLKERRMFVSPVHPEMGPAALPRFPVLVDGRPMPVRGSSPLVGEHTEEVLRDVLGLSEDEIADLIVNEVV